MVVGSRIVRCGQATTGQVVYLRTCPLLESHKVLGLSSHKTALRVVPSSWFGFQCMGCLKMATRSVQYAHFVKVSAVRMHSSDLTRDFIYCYHWWHQ